MLKDCLTELPCFARASPVVLISKKLGNSKQHCYSNPTLQEIQDILFGTPVFSSLDLNSRYWHMEMDPEV